jgi:hypothetical protein
LWDEVVLIVLLPQFKRSEPADLKTELLLGKTLLLLTGEHTGLATRAILDIHEESFE